MLQSSAEEKTTESYSTITDVHVKTLSKPTPVNVYTIYSMYRPIEKYDQKFNHTNIFSKDLLLTISFKKYQMAYTQSKYSSQN